MTSNQHEKCSKQVDTNECLNSNCGMCNAQGHPICVSGNEIGPTTDMFGLCDNNS